MLTRRSLLTVPAALTVPALTAAALAAEPDWEAFKVRFLRPDGRIVDTGNGDISHTEGQGWGMYFAERWGDAESFSRIWGWTARNLRRPRDRLSSWRFDPSSAAPVKDRNNATDGDLFIAASLARAGVRWHQSDYTASAAAIARDILRVLVRKAGPYTVLLPGADGFATSETVVINPSYYVFPALQTLSAAVPDEAWGEVQRDGLALIEAGRFGRWHLPPDWLQISLKDGTLAPAPGWPARFSYDAVRVPLYLAWAQSMSGTLSAAFQAWWQQPAVPAWTDLGDNSTAPYPAPSGMAAVGALVTGKGDAIPALSAAPDYYSAALILLSRLAWQDTH